MDIEIVGDVVSLDPELLQLPEVSPLALKTSPQIAEELFAEWLSLPDTGRLVKSLVNDAKAGTSFGAPGNSCTTNASGGSPLPSLFPAGSAPPLSPRSAAGSPRTMKQRSTFSSLGSPLKLVSEPVREVIPQFYFQDCPPPPKELREQFLSRIDDFFNGSTDGLQVHEFKSVTKDICQLPSFISTTLFLKIDTNGTGIVTRDAFIKYWIDSNMSTLDIATQIFKILNQPDCKYLTQADFKPVLRELLATHPGLEFLQSTPEFQERYAETVIYRIFCYVNRFGNGHLTLRELRQGNLIAAMQHADDEEDINKVLRFPGSLLAILKGRWGIYEDFVYFKLAEEDKSSEPSLEYWFKCIDLDGNGFLNEMQFFYEEQVHRMECMAQEPVLFEDILCQIVDMISPEREDYITIRNFKECKLSGNVFNILFNLNKFMAFETRYPFLIRQEREDPTLTEWERFAHREYIRLSMEEDGGSNGSAEVWDESLEEPF